jgi:DNA-binding ferritin-like protein
MSRMSTTHTHTDLLDLADDFAERIRAIQGKEVPTGDDFVLIEQLTSHDGLVIPEEDVVVWLRTDDMTVVVWGGNAYDYDMGKLAEVKL